MTMSRTNLRSFFVFAPFAASLAAQSLTISEGNLAFTTGAPAMTSHAPPTADLRSDALATDHAFQHGWYYRVAGDTREFALRDIGPTSGGVTAFLTHADRDFADVDNRGLFRAAWDLDGYATGPASGVVTSRLTVLNTSATNLTIDLFAYTDLDIAGTHANDTATGNGVRHVVSDWTGVQIELVGVGADRSDVLVHPGVLDLLTDTDIDDLGNNQPPFTGDYTGAFQWSAQTLPPGGQRSFTLILAVDTPATAVPEVEAYGRGSHTGCEIYTDTLPLQDHSGLRQIGIHLTGGVPFALVGLLSSTQALPGVPFAGLELWVESQSGPVQFSIGTLNGSGYTQYVFPIPASPYLTGFPIYHQYFYADPGVPAGASHSGALLTRLGRL
ncbi:MAG: hypothetical protein NXI31_22150 [bacterium]|nr:hypothetical protein [bacterium]